VTPASQLYAEHPSRAAKSTSSRTTSSQSRSSSCTSPVSPQQSSVRIQVRCQIRRILGSSSIYGNCRMNCFHLRSLFSPDLQSLCLEDGVRAERLSVVKHGLLSKIHHTSKDPFKGVGSLSRFGVIPFVPTFPVVLTLKSWRGLTTGRRTGWAFVTKPLWGV